MTPEELERVELGIDERLGADIRALMLDDEVIKLNDVDRFMLAALCRLSFASAIRYASQTAPPEIVTGWLTDLGYPPGASL